MNGQKRLHMLSTTVIYAPLFAGKGWLSFSGRCSIDVSVRVEGSSTAVVSCAIAVGQVFQPWLWSNLAADECENTDEQNGSEEVSKVSVAISEKVGGIVADFHE